MPLPILLVELKACQMANDTGHRHRALTPWRAEVEIEFVVFHERVAADAVLYQYDFLPALIVLEVLTVLNCPPLRC